MPQVIKPTVGRKLWFFASAQHAAEHAIGEHHSQPFDATVLFVESDNIVNLHVIDHLGQRDAVIGAWLVQPGDDAEPGGPHARWMDYQIAQAGKAETVEPDSDPAVNTDTPEADSPAESLGTSL